MYCAGTGLFLRTGLTYGMYTLSECTNWPLVLYIYCASHGRSISKDDQHAFFTERRKTKINEKEVELIS